MKTKTIETITRHLKGIVAALDKEKDQPMYGLPKIYKYSGKSLNECTDKEVLKAWYGSLDLEYTSGMRLAIWEEMEKRNLHEIRIKLTDKEFDESNLTKLLDKM